MVPFWQRRGFEILEILEMLEMLAMLSLVSLKYLTCQTMTSENSCAPRLQVFQQPAEDLVQCKLKEVCLDRAGKGRTS